MRSSIFGSSFYQPLGALIYMIATIAEINRAPFDMPEAEQELTAGYHIEYSGMKFALFFMAEYIKMIAISMIGASLFLGGFQGPLLDVYPWLGPIYLFIKVVGSALWPDLDPRHPAAHPLRPADGIWLENSLPAVGDQFNGNGSGACIWWEDRHAAWIIHNLQRDARQNR